jgi:general nucleoside transport system ATP-binding protein
VQATPEATPEPLVRMRGIVKQFGTLTANDSVNLDLFPGEVLALLGENGAGKSTLMRLLYGLYPIDAGNIEIGGNTVTFSSPRDAMAAGVGMVFQQFSLLPALSILDNLLVALPNAPWWQGRRRPEVNAALSWLKRLAPHLDPNRSVLSLSVGEWQIVELAKVLNLDPRVVILDEPTSVLTPLETEKLYQFVRELAQRGKTVVMVTHKIADVFACADRYAVMRRGHLIEEAPVAGCSPAKIITAMVGSAPDNDLTAPPAPVDRVARLDLRNISTAPEFGNCPISDLTLDIARGEIVGVAGVTGNGQSALAEAIVGMVPLTAGEITLDGASIASHGGTPDPSDSIAYIPERPLDNAVVADLDLATNLALRQIPREKLLLQRAKWYAQAADLIERFDVRPPRPRAQAASLSGGNLQRLVIARELSHSLQLVVACYPTMGLDVLASQTVRAHLFERASRGAAVLWFSEDLDELLGYAHRIAVLYGGRLIGVERREEATREGIGRMMTGSSDHKVVS